MLSQNQDFDVIVVGASFAGSTFAQTAAEQGARVLLLEKDFTVGHAVHTTGVLINEVLELADIPSSLLLDPVNTFYLYPPDRNRIVVSAPGFRYWMSDTAGLLQGLFKAAITAGAECELGACFVDARPTTEGITVYYHKGANQRAQARFLVGADGPLSRVAAVSHLHRNQRFLSGAEWIVEGLSPPMHTFSLIFDYSLAPGYCAWLAPRGGRAAVGVAGYAWQFSPVRALHQAIGEFSALFGNSNLHIVERKGGIIPIGGPAAKMCSERVMLLGDAAGLCGPATGGGIFTAMVSGRLAADAVLQYLNGDNHALLTFRHHFFRFYHLGTYFFLEGVLRELLDALALNISLQFLFDYFRPPARLRLLQQGLLETHISEMGRLPWGLMLSGLLHPLHYREAVAGALRLGLGGLTRVLDRILLRLGASTHQV